MHIFVASPVETAPEQQTVESAAQEVSEPMEQEAQAAPQLGSDVEQSRDEAVSVAPVDAMESEEPLEAEKSQNPPAMLPRTTSSPFLDLKAPTSPMGGGETNKLFFGNKTFGATKEGSAAPSIFQLPNSAVASTTTTTPFGNAASGSAPLSLFGRPLGTQTNPSPSPLSGGMFGAKSAVSQEKPEQPKTFAAFSSLPKGVSSFGAAASGGVNPFAAVKQAAANADANEGKSEDVAPDAKDTEVTVDAESTQEVQTTQNAIESEETAEEPAESPKKTGPSPQKASEPVTPAVAADTTKSSASKPKPVVLSVSSNTMICVRFETCFLIFYVGRINCTRKNCAQTSKICWQQTSSEW